MNYISIDVGTTSGIAFFEDVKLIRYGKLKGETALMQWFRFGELGKELGWDLESGVAVYIEFPSSIHIPGRNVSDAIATCRMAAELGLLFKTAGCSVRFVGANDWSRKNGKIMTDKERRIEFARLFGGKYDGKSVWKDGKRISMDVIDACLMGIYTYQLRH